MFVTTSQLGSADFRTVVFEMDGQLFSSANDNEITEFKLSMVSEEESSNLLMIIIIIVVALLILIGVGAYFFTFEEEFEEEFTDVNSQQQSADPYAWAKQKTVPEITTQQPVQQVQQPVQQVQQQVQQQAATSQHPGWIWDTNTNQWVPDPNYVHEQ
jgi:hypothetical protein